MLLYLFSIFLSELKLFFILKFFVYITGYYEDEPVTQEEVRDLVKKSMESEINNLQLMDKMIQTTPKKLFQK